MHLATTSLYVDTKYNKISVFLCLWIMKINNTLNMPNITLMKKKDLWLIFIVKKASAETREVYVMFPERITKKLGCQMKILFVVYSKVFA